MLRSPKVAVPDAAVTVVVPARVTPPGLVPIASVTSAALATTLPNWSWTSTWTAGVMIADGAVVAGWTLNASRVAGPGATVTVAVWVIPTPLMMAETILACATFELSAPVATPSAPVGAAGWVKVLRDPEAESTTVAPLTGFPLPSLAVTVIVATLDPPPAAIVVGAALTVDCDAETPLGGGGGGPPGAPWQAVLPVSV